MIALYDHIQALRAELWSCHLTMRERAESEAELARAIARQADLDRVFDEVFEVEFHHAAAPE